MPLGDDLVNQGGLIGPVNLTPELKRAGVQLATSATTDVVEGGELGEILVEAEQGRDTVTPAPTQAPEGPKNPFSPRQSVDPQDLKFTARGEELKERSGFFSKLGDILTSEGTAELLAEAGIAIAEGAPPGQNISTSIGESALRNIEGLRRQRLREQLNAGVPPEEANVRGLSSQARAEEIQRFTAGQDRQTALQRQEAEDIRTEAEFEQDQEFGQKRIELLTEELRNARESDDPSEFLRAAEQVTQIPFTKNIDSSKLSPDQAESLVREATILKRTDPSRTNTSIINEANKNVALESAGRELARIQAEMLEVGTGRGTAGLRSDMFERQAELTDRIIAAGGDPTELTKKFLDEALKGGKTGGGSRQELERRVVEKQPSLEGRDLSSFSDEDLRVFLEED